MTHTTIGVVTTSYPRFAGDPAGGFVAGHVAALRALGHHVEVIAAGERQDGADRGDTDLVTRIPSELFYRGGAPDLLEAAPIGSAISAITFTARLAAEIAKRRWDSMIAHWLAPSAIAALPSRVPLLAIAHGGDVHTLRRMRLLAPTLYALRARGARLAFVSEDLRSIARVEAPGLARWLDQATVQPMGVAVEHFRSIPREPIDPPMIMIASRLVPVKGIDVAIAAMKHVRAPARLVVAGDGPARAALQRLAIRQAPTQRDLATPEIGCTPAWIEFVGEVPTVERDRLLSRASVVVIPSRVLPSGRTEGMPTIALEALATGVPVIASAVGGLSAWSEIHQVPPDDPRALAAAIDRTLADPPAAHRLRAAVEHLDWSRVAMELC